MIVAFPVSSLLFNFISLSNAIDRLFRDDDVVEPIYSVSIIAPGWHEPDEYLEASLYSIANQNIIRKYPEYFELIFVGCEGVNLDIPDKYGFIVVCARQGKLYARHKGILESNGDIIVSVDTDTYYPRNWLNLMLKPYKEYDDVVATTCNTWQGILEPFMHNLITLVYSLRMSGRGSTFLRDAYFKVGGFNLNIDQSNMTELVREEEINFRWKLSKLGRIVVVDAPVYHFGGIDTTRGIRIYSR